MKAALAFGQSPPAQHIIELVLLPSPCVRWVRRLCNSTRGNSIPPQGWWLPPKVPIRAGTKYFPPPAVEYLHEMSVWVLELQSKCVVKIVAIGRENVGQNCCLRGFNAQLDGGRQGGATALDGPDAVIVGFSHRVNELPIAGSGRLPRGPRASITARTGYRRDWPYHAQ